MKLLNFLIRHLGLMLAIGIITLLFAIGIVCYHIGIDEGLNQCAEIILESCK